MAILKTRLHPSFLLSLSQLQDSSSSASFPHLTPVATYSKDSGDSSHKGKGTLCCPQDIPGVNVHLFTLGYEGNGAHTTGFIVKPSLYPLMRAIPKIITAGTADLGKERLA